MDYFDVDDFALREEAVLSYPTGSGSGDRCTEMNIVLTSQGRTPMLMRCRWQCEKHEERAEPRLRVDGTAGGGGA